MNQEQAAMDRETALVEKALADSNAQYPNDPLPVLAREVYRLRKVREEQAAQIRKLECHIEALLDRLTDANTDLAHAIRQSEPAPMPHITST